MQYRLIIVYWDGYTPPMVTESKYMILSFKSKRFGFVTSAYTMRWFFFAGMVVVLSWIPGKAQITTFPSEVSDPGQTFVPVPVVYFTPETNWAFGARASYTFHLDTLHRRPSTLQLGGIYTLRKQFLSTFNFNLYHPEKRWELEGDAGYYKYVYK